MPDTLRLGTRTTPLARYQAEFVAADLQARHPGLKVELVPFVTEGDRKLAQSLPEIGGKGVFTAELEAALYEKRIDLAVHSLKDLPVAQPDGLTLTAVLAREDARDAWVCAAGHSIAEIAEGAVVGTSSLRRAAQLLTLRPDLKVRSIRGSVETRLRKVRDGQYDATLLAFAGLYRLGLAHEVTTLLDFESMLPAAGQAALAVQSRAEDDCVNSFLSAIDDIPSRVTTTAERAFLQALGGGCSAPIGAYARLDAGEIHLQGVVLLPDGSRRIDVAASGVDAQVVGEHAAQQAFDAGAREVLGG